MEQSGLSEAETAQSHCVTEIREVKLSLPDAHMPADPCEPERPAEQETRIMSVGLAPTRGPPPASSLSSSNPRKKTCWSVCLCHSPTGQQRAAEGGLVVALPPRQAPPLSAFDDLIDVPAPLPLSAPTARRENDRQDMDMTYQRRTMHQREQERKLSRLDQHVQGRPFDRSFAIHALKILVLESSRYQRTFYHPSTGFPTRALVAARSHRLFRKQPKTYMMLTNREARTLLDDIDLLLNPAQPVDRSENVLQQLVGLSLFTPSAFPLTPR